MTEENLAPDVSEGQANETSTETQQEAENKSVNWFDSFEGEDLGYIRNKGWDKEDGMQQILKSYRNLEKMKGVPEDRLIKIPEGEDGWDEVFKRLGKPESAEGYEYKPEEGKELDEERLDWFSKTAFDLNLTKQQHNKLVQAASEYESNVFNSFQKQQEEQRTIEHKKLKDDWGNAYDERIELGKRAYRAFIDDETVVDKMEDALGHADVMRFFAKLGESISEDKLPSVDNDRRFGYSKEQALADIQQLKSEIKGDSERLQMFNKGTGADIEKLARLRKIAYD